MTEKNAISRRTALKMTGAAAATALVAGCSDDDNGDDNGGNGDDNGDEGVNIEGGSTIELDGYSSHWEGVAPSDIEGDNNPTLILEDGEEYTFEWTNADGLQHDLQIWDDDDEVVDDLISDEEDEEGETVSLDVTASEEMAAYVCSYHDANQIGELVVE